MWMGGWTLWLTITTAVAGDDDAWFGWRLGAPHPALVDGCGSHQDVTVCARAGQVVLVSKPVNPALRALTFDRLRERFRGCSTTSWETMLCEDGPQRVSYTDDRLTVWMTALPAAVVEGWW